MSLQLKCISCRQHIGWSCIIFLNPFIQCISFKWKVQPIYTQGYLLICDILFCHIASCFLAILVVVFPFLIVCHCGFVVSCSGTIWDLSLPHLYISFTSELYIFMCFGDGKCTFASSCRTPLGSFCRIGLMVMNSLIICLSGTLILFYFWRTILLDIVFLGGIFIVSAL